MKQTLTVVLFIMFGYMTINAQVHSLDKLNNLQITQGEKVDYSTIISDVKLDGDSADINVNLPDTSILSQGRHTLVFTAMTFMGKTATKEIFLDVDNSNAISDAPTISNVTDHTFSEGRLFNLKEQVTAVDSNGRAIDFTVNIKYPEHLAPGQHNIYYTAIDKNGKTKVEKCTVTVNKATVAEKRAEWARLGYYLYNKYFEPTRFEPYYETDKDGNFTSKIIKSFTYAPELDAITAEVFNQDIKYDQISFDAIPIKIEPQLARMMLLINELHHHRYLWKDKKQVIVQVAMRGRLVHAGESTSYYKDRGLHSIRIPISIFKQDNFMERLFDKLTELSDIETKIFSREDGKGYLVHKILESKDNTDITILYEQDYREGYYPAYKDQLNDGTITMEANIDMDMLRDEYNSNLTRFKNMEFGPFTNPKLPYIKAKSN